MLYVASNRARYLDRLVTVNSRQDPTRTTMIRRAYENDLVRRFKKVKSAIIREVTPYNFGPTVNTPKFAFTRSDDKVAAFMKWLDEQVRDDILEVMDGVPVTRAAQNAWQNKYVLSSYQRGIAMSARAMKAASIRVEDSWVEGAMMRPIHADRIGLIYTRAYSDLRGITDAMDKQISRSLANGIAQGWSMYDIAEELADRVDKIGITRARVLARTEVISAHADATLNTYEEAGVVGVSVLSEFATAQDNRVCPQCEELEGKEYTMQEARGVIPVHPNCRCAWLPVVKDGNGKVLR